MKKTGFKAAIFVLLVITVLASQAIAGPGGGGRSRDGGQGWERGMAAGPRMGRNLESVRPDSSRGPKGPYCPFCQGQNQNIGGRQGRGGRGFQGRGAAMQGRGGRGFQGRGMAIQGRRGRGIRDGGPTMQGRGGRDFQSRGPTMQGRGGRGFQGRGPAMQGRGDRGYQGRGTAMQGRGNAPQGLGMIGRRGQSRPEGIGRPGPDMQPRRFTPGDTGRPMPPRSRGWAPGWGQNQQPEKAPDTNAPQGWRMNGRRGQFGPGGIGRPGQGMQPRRFTPEDTDRTNQPTPPRGRDWGQGWRPDPQPEKAPDE